MNRSVTHCLLLFLFAMGMLSGGAARGDLVKLKGGGELRGVFLDKVVTGRAGAPVRVETLTGGIVTVSQDDVEFLAKRSRSIEEYEWKTRLATNTVDAHWELQEWCKQQGLKKEREAELLLIVSLDPEHEGAHRMLGHIRQDGKWMTRDESMAAKGYVKYKGKYLFPQEVELLEASSVHRDAEVDWHKKLHIWQGWLHSSNPARQIQARQELQDISDADAVGPLVKMFRNEAADDVRLIFVRTLARLQSTAAVQALVIQSLFDSSSAVRVAAMEGITGKSRDIAIPIYTRALSDEMNDIVCRSAVALGHFGDPEAIPNLIDVLSSTHTYRQKVQETGYLATQGGSPLLQPVEIVLPPRDIPLAIPGVPLPLSTTTPGAIYPGNAPPQSVVAAVPVPVTRERTVLVTREFQNTEVLAALRKLTHEDFGYDKRTWTLWWTANRSNLKSGAVQK